jgi:hypothetical protein
MKWIFFNLLSPSSRSMTLESNQPLAEINQYQESSCGVKGGQHFFIVQKN